ncbi:MAG TPA: GtrA family protein [Acidimicrobiales bacterium]|nr:GtrA family protein [Acidimicrobiales bacterium]
MPRQAPADRLPRKIVLGAQELLARATGRASLAGALRKLARYATVSAISTSVTLSLLGILVYTKALSPGWANLVATGVGTVPSFELNRRWVWSKHTKRSVFREMVPFCALSFTGLGLSTVVVSLAARWATSAGLGSGATALISQAANLATFGALWVVQFFLLDRVLFGRSQAQPGTADSVGPGEAGPYRTRPCMARRDEAPPGGARPDGARPGEAGRDQAEPDAAGPEEAGPDEPGPDAAGPDASARDVRPGTVLPELALAGRAGEAA